MIKRTKRKSFVIECNWIKCGKSKLNWLFEFRPILNALHIQHWVWRYCLSVETWINVRSGACLPIKYMKNCLETWNHTSEFRNDEFWISNLWPDDYMSHQILRFFCEISFRATSPSVCLSKYQFSIFKNMTFCHYQHLLKWKMHLNWYVTWKQKRNWKPNAFANGIIHCVNVIPILIILRPPFYSFGCVAHLFRWNNFRWIAKRRKEKR